MALVIDLKPGEKLLIGETVITNGSQRTKLQISGKNPILREKDVLQEEQADTPCKKIYFLLQCMYMANNPSEYHEDYFNIMRDIQTTAPSTAVFFLDISQKVLEGNYYKAMKIASDLIKYERELINNATE